MIDTGEETNDMHLSGKFFVASLILFVGTTVSTAQEIKAIPLEPGEKSYMLLLNGPPETKSFRSGVVTLEPGKSVGVHNSGVNEEILVPLEGQGELQFSNHASVTIKPGMITYAPAHSEHNVLNTGSSRLRYIFITAKAE